MGLLFYFLQINAFVGLKQLVFIALHVAQLIGNKLAFANKEFRSIPVVMSIYPKSNFGQLN
jgi:hypothetical protein